MPPRPTILLAAALAACAVPDSVDAEARWRDDRLADVLRRHAPKAAAAVFPEDAAAGAEAPQEPAVAPVVGRIDQREPQGLGVGARPFRSLGGQVAVGARFGIGSVEFEVPDSRLDDRASALSAALTIDSGVGTARGAGLHVETVGTDAELFAGRRINDGIEPALADAAFQQIDAFPHLRFDTVAGRFTMPVRAGVFLDWTRLDHSQATIEREWLSAGPRLALEPTVRLLGRTGRSIDLAARIGGDVGATWFSESFRGGDDDDRAVRFAGEAGIGLRLDLGAVQGELGVAARHTGYGETDSELFGDRHRTWVRHQQVYFGLQARF